VFAIAEKGFKLASSKAPENTPIKRDSKTLLVKKQRTIAIIGGNKASQAGETGTPGIPIDRD
jgi:hypothetical protein